MKILEHRLLNELLPAKVQYIRIDPEDVSATLADILRVLMDLSWLKNFDEEYEQIAFNSKAQKTINDIKEKFAKCNDDKITKEAGEYVVSELSREALINSSLFKTSGRLYSSVLYARFFFLSLLLTTCEAT